ncbi:hypothetical protein MRX96_005241 [Rhipicephalus microplus]
MLAREDVLIIARAAIRQEEVPPSTYTWRILPRAEHRVLEDRHGEDVRALGRRGAAVGRDPLSGSSRRSPKVPSFFNLATSLMTRRQGAPVISSGRETKTGLPSSAAAFKTRLTRVSWRSEMVNT